MAVKTLFPYIILLFVSFNGLCQHKYDADDFDFVMYLIGNGMKDEAVTLMQNTQKSSDSILFLKGYTFYNAKMLEKAVENFANISCDHQLFTESKFFSALSDAHLFRLEESEKTLRQISDSDAQIRNLKTFEYAGIKLLRRDTAAFQHYFNKTDTDDYRLSAECKNLAALNSQINAFKRKSPVIAGTLSALVPGLGKVYAGNVGEGISSFLVCGSLMAVTAENFHKKGVANWKTILFGSLSAVFYIGNIYGSIATVKVNCDHFNSQIDVQILYNIHIPVRNAFRR